MPAKTRDPRWDNAKFFLIYLVIVGHIMEPFCDEFAFRLLNRPEMNRNAGMWNE